jgi:hypothetical protein
MMKMQTTTRTAKLLETGIQQVQPEVRYDSVFDSRNRVDKGALLIILADRIFLDFCSKICTSTVHSLQSTLYVSVALNSSFYFPPNFLVSASNSCLLSVTAHLVVNSFSRLQLYPDCALLPTGPNFVTCCRVPWDVRTVWRPSVTNSHRGQ